MPRPWQKVRVDSMTKEFWLTLVLAFFVVLVGLMAVGWYARRRRQRNIPAPLPVPENFGAELARFTGFYVSTTPDGEPLNRIAVRGLGFRARASLLVTEAGLIVSLPASDFFIPKEDLREASKSRYTIDRVVEEGGLALIAWTLGDVKLDSYFRVEQTARLVDAVASLISRPAFPSEPASPNERETA
ncbi:MAG: hypothetical protein JWR36_2348 [Glaciihabitans sp.]|nr:hypothetical protein [Glaciihabitans sp.]